MSTLTFGANHVCTYSIHITECALREGRKNKRHLKGLENAFKCPFKGKLMLHFSEG